MTRLVLFLAAPFLLALLFSTERESAVTNERGGTYVFDGDTLAWGGARWRLRALAAPERHEKGGLEATRALQAIVETQGIAKCVPTRGATSRAIRSYDRLVGDCETTTGEDVAMLMILAGVARHCPAFGRADLWFLPVNDSLPLPPYCRRSHREGADGVVGVARGDAKARRLIDSIVKKKNNIKE